MTTTDAALFRRWIRHRDANAFTRLVERHSSMVMGASQRIVGNAADAEEIAQDCLFKLSRHDRLVHYPAAWLHTAAVRSALDRVRGDRRRSRRESAYAQWHKASSTADVETAQVLELLDETLGELDERFRGPIVLRFLEAKTQVEVAEQLGISRTAVQKRIDKGLARLREGFRKRGVPISKDALSAIMGSQAPLWTAPQALMTAINNQVLATMCSRPPVSALNCAWQAACGWKGALICGAIVCVAIMGGAASHYARALYRPAPTNAAGVVSAMTFSADKPSSGAGTSSKLSDASAAGAPHAAKEGAGGVSAAGAEFGQGTLVKTGKFTAEDAKNAAEGDTEKCSLSGLVNDETMRPVVQAKVRVRQTKVVDGIEAKDETTVSSAEDGSYAFAGLEPGAVHMWAEAPGYVIENDSRRLQPGENTADFVLKTARHYIKGIVLDQGEKPVVNAQVYVSSLRQEKQVDGQTMYLCCGFSPEMIVTMSEESGSFELAVPEEGSYMLTVAHADFPNSEFPNIQSDTTDAKLVLLAAGSVSGRVTRSDGSPYAGAQVTIIGTSPYEPQATAIVSSPTSRCQQIAPADADGRYVLENLSSQNVYDLGVYAPDEKLSDDGWWKMTWRPLASRQGIRPEPGRTLEGIDFRVPDNPYVTLSGRVLDQSTGGPVTDVTIGVSIGNPYRYLGSENPAPDGSYKLEFTLNEKSQVRVTGTYTGQIGGYEAPVSRADTGESPIQLDMSPGDQLNVDLKVAMPLRIPVLVTDGAGRPVEGATVGVGRVDADGTRAPGERVIKTDASGRCVCDSLPPQFQYYVWVQEFGNVIGGDAIRLAQSPIISAAQGNPAPEVVLVIEPKAGFEGIFVDADGTPFPTAAVSVSAVGAGQPETMDFESRESGVFCVVNGLPEGTYQALVFTLTTSEGVYEASVSDVTLQSGLIAQLGTIVAQRK